MGIAIRLEKPEDYREVENLVSEAFMALLPTQNCLLKFEYSNKKTRH
jgi:hypothetical protein